MKRPPPFILVAVMAALMTLLLVGALTMQVKRQSAAEARRDCERAVAARHDARAMWLYLIDTATENPAKVRTFAAKLDELLPPLRCDDGNWVPRPTD